MSENAIVKERHSDGFVEVKTDSGEIVWLRGINGTPSTVGTRGHLEWHDSASFHLQFFVPQREEIEG